MLPSSRANCAKPPAARGVKKLKVQLHAKLHDARVARGRDFVEQAGRRRKRAATDRVRMIESVKCLPAELAGEAFAEFEVFEKGQVGTPEARATDRTWMFRADRCLCRIRIGERCGVEPAREEMRRA